MVDSSFILVALLFFLRFLSMIILARILLSWFVPHSGNPIILFIRDTTEQIFAPLRKILPHQGVYGMIDWTPLAALIGIDLLRSFIFGLV